MKDPSPDPQRLARVRELLGRADSLPPGEREAFVRKAAGADTKLADEVLALLGAQADAVDVTIDVQQAAAAGLSPAEPSEIGPYRILDTLGEGGMGTVYLAEQSAPVKRRVALKLIKLGMDSKAVVARFEQERQALALMQHDGIAKVYDCGTSDRGQPFFVMELVKGVPLNEFCEQSQLSLPQRLLLMKQVCAAGQHAHQKGVVHRDLKPGNVLVSDEGGKLPVKIIDFGLAKAMGQKLVEATLVTEAGQVVGTPEYMAPEQADPTNADIDTRADIYSLGVMLYEVLVGQLPFSGAQLRQAGMLEMQRVLREVQPPKPSTKLTTIADSAAVVAQARRMSVGALQKALKNELDWVVLKALEKDRNRRYDTANALAADLQRFLDHEPLVAGPPSTGYRLRLFVQKHRGQVLAAAAVLLTAVVGAGIAINYAIAADANARRADQNAATAQTSETLATQRAEENAKLAQEKGALAASESAAKEQFASKVREFNLLAMVELVERVRAEAQDLHPPWPRKIKAMQNWQRECADLLMTRDEIRDVQAELVRRAAASRDLGIDNGGSFLAVRRVISSMQRALAIHEGKEKLVLPELGDEERRLNAGQLHELVQRQMDPGGGAFLRGSEAKVLALLRRASSLADSGDATGPSRPERQYWLGVALLQNGQFEEATRCLAEAEASLPSGESMREVRALQVEMQHGMQDSMAMLARRESGLAGQFLQQTLTKLLADLDQLAAVEQQRVAQDLAWAEQVTDLTLRHPRARVSWAEARAAIASNPKYAGQSFELREQDITGLVPIGENPVTHLWEFYELRSAWDGKADPRAIAIPHHEPDGSIEVTGDTGIVFVLLPGGTFLMGAQVQDEDAPNFDPQAYDNESPPHPITLAPFFLARHELTQGQWARLWSGDPSLRDPSQYKAGKNSVGKAITLANPVESVDWTMCDTLLSRHGLVLPTEAQWECGCRAGTATPWLCPLEELKRYDNVADARAKRAAPSWTCEAWSDGHVVHAPVGSFAANGFGLYDMHGNVREWCRDEFGSYSGPVRAGDGLRLRSDGSRLRCSRGGSFISPAVIARSACRRDNAPSIRSFDLGARPARLITF